MATVLISSTFLQHFQLDRHDFFFVENILVSLKYFKRFLLNLAYGSVANIITDIHKGIVSVMYISQ